MDQFMECVVQQLKKYVPTNFGRFMSFPYRLPGIKLTGSQTVTGDAVAPAQGRVLWERRPRRDGPLVELF